MSLPTYPKYKPSGVKWLGDVPEHWDVGVLRRYAQMKTGHTPSRQVVEYWENCTVPWFGLADVWQLRDGSQKYLGETNELISEAGLKNSAAELLPVGTVVFSRTASVGFSGIMRVPMATTQDFWNWVCGPRLLPDYLLYAFRSMASEFRRLTMGSTHKTIYQPDAAAMKVCVPPLHEQRAIVEFIEANAASVDSLVGEQRRLVELLKEQRQAVVSRAVTIGLDRSASVKRSPDAWLPDVPAHWAIKPLKHIAEIDNSGCYGVEPENGAVVLPVATTAQINRDGEFAVNQMPLRGFSHDEAERYRCTEGDVLVVKSSGSATKIISGKAGLVDSSTPSFVFSNFLMRVRPNHDQILPRFLYLLLTSRLTRQRVERMCSTTTYPNLDVPEYTSALLPVPPRSEQLSILAFLEKFLSRSNTLIGEADRATALLQERRAALISAAVTGKIDVRGLTDAEAA